MAQTSPERSDALPAPTPVELGLLEAICQDADDDAPRLIYADWLDETEIPLLTARAEFIRLQCRRAALPADDPQREDLKKRERALLAQHGQDWLRRLLPAEFHCLVDKAPIGFQGMLEIRAYARGFAADLTLWQTARRPIGPSVAALLRVGPVRHLELYSSVLGLGHVLEATPQAAGLRHLRLWYELYERDTGPRIPQHELHPLLLTPNLRNLKVLQIEGWRLGAKAIAPLPQADNLRSLTELHLSATGINDKTLPVVLQFPHLRNLTVLNLSANGITAAGGRLLAQTPGLDNLAVLDLTTTFSPEWDNETVTALRDRFGEKLQLTFLPV